MSASISRNSSRLILLMTSDHITWSNNSIQSSIDLLEVSLWMEIMELKVFFGFIMASLCFITIFGNICVIYRFSKDPMVSFIHHID